MLKLENISHGYGEQRVLENVSLTLEAGQRLALMGPSGCGKTTLLRIAMGLLTPDGGAVKNTFVRTAAVFQEPRLLPWATALGNVNLVLSDHKTTLPKAEEYLELVDLKEARDKFPRELSGGMQQRVSLARALAVEGDCLILDEPFKAMDEALRQQIMALVKERNAAILLVTHDEEEAAALGCEILHFADLT